MKKTRFTEEQMVTILREADARSNTADMNSDTNNCYGRRGVSSPVKRTVR